MIVSKSDFGEARRTLRNSSTGLISTIFLAIFFRSVVVHFFFLFSVSVIGFGDAVVVVLVCEHLSLFLFAKWRLWKIVVFPSKALFLQSSFFI